MPLCEAHQQTIDTLTRIESKLDKMHTDIGRLQGTDGVMVRISGSTWRKVLPWVLAAALGGGAVGMSFASGKSSDQQEQPIQPQPENSTP